MVTQRDPWQRSRWRRLSVALLVLPLSMQHVGGLWGHISHTEREMEAPEHQKGPCDQPQFDHLWVREMMAHLRHKRRIEGRRGLCQLARERQGRLFLGGARRRAR